MTTRRLQKLFSLLPSQPVSRKESRENKIVEDEHSFRKKKVFVRVSGGIVMLVCRSAVLRMDSGNTRSY